MKILIIGATGTIGQAIVSELESKHQIIKASRSQGDILIDLSSSASINSAFAKLTNLDAVICAAGAVAFAPFNEMTREQWDIGINSRLMGQIYLVQQAARILNDNGSITLTTGIIADHSISTGISAATLSGAIHHFVPHVALELTRGIRVNCVSPSVLTESLDTYADYFPGFQSISAKEVAQYYVRAVEGVETGKVFKAYKNN
ncbi:short chain dehydrogenase [Parashewanella curva]|uniref:Short chain dehydrogenase n=1 Tax=Parashewanella curva TaxID=2338552 RepID=A0A3L8Q3J8_9GAMM|nr:short chain dehydrogenase [Parashewanella curva]RLV61723.1 short chain dehydrogenase [Parashewanella curva]